MTIETVKKETALVVSMTGRMDAVTAPDYEKKIGDLMSVGENDFIIDFSDLEYISSAGLRALLSTSRRIKENNGRIHLSNITGNVREVFDMSGFGSIFIIYDSNDQALDAMKS
jgi:stage II sporulation protein AA (anti-sigma F factor antagonist)